MKAGLYAGAALAGGLLLYTLVKKRPGESLATTAGREVVGAAVDVVGDVAVGAVKGIGTVIGIPDTNTDQCSADIAAGRTWDASFSCPASRFIGSIFNSTTITAAENSDARQIDRIIERQQASIGGLSGSYDAMGNYTGDYAQPNVGVTGSW